MKLIKYFSIVCLAIFGMVLIVNLRVNWKSNKYIFDNVQQVPECYTAIVLGAFVYKSGNPSNILQDRLDVAIELYKNKKVKRFLLSGDHGQVGYDEVNNMMKYLLDNGVDTVDIFLDHAGFDTYNSMVRAKEIFQVKDAVIVTQEFHLPRAVYIARSKGLNAYGIKADKRNYASINRLKFREIIANMKAFYELLINKNPRYLGEKIPITGDSRLSYD
jgi:SanA protein